MSPMPSLRSRRISANRCSTSSRCRLLVGSSIRTMRAREATARQISTTCCAAIGSAPTGRSGRSSGCEKLPSTSSASASASRAGGRQPAARRLAARAGCSRRRSGAGRATAPGGSARRRAGSRRAARPGRYGCARQLHLALVGRQRAGEDVHQRALAGAVLADERVHLVRAASANDTPSSATVGPKRLRMPSSASRLHQTLDRPPRDWTARRGPRPRLPRRRQA